jgi:16S rRNA (guanine1516-N2)-methyltransferase
VRRASRDPATTISKAPGLPARGFAFELGEETGRLTLYGRHHPDYGGVAADWTTAELRRRVAAGRRQLLSRAIGLHQRHPLDVFDATAGLGRDAFTLAALGANLWLAERQPLFHKLLLDALRRALLDAVAAQSAARMRVLEGDARDHLAAVRWDVIYLDPMYPGHDRDALSGKELQFLRELTDGDPDADGLLPPALKAAKRRVVVKRPLKAPWLAAQQPSFSLKGTQARFDVYLGQASDLRE